MAIEGPLSELSIQDVLQLLDLTRKTGILTVHSPRLHDEAVVYFEKGTIVYARRRRSLRLLGQQLLRAGKLTERELDRALDVQRQSESRRIGEILLELGSVGVEELERQIAFQIEETIYDLMGWDEGDFRFEEHAGVPHDDLIVRVRVESLLMEGARRIDEWSRLEPRIPSLESVARLNDLEEGSSPLDLRPDEWEVLAEIDGTRDIRQIAADLGRSNFDVAKIIFGLVTTGVVAVEDSGRATRQLEPAMLELESALARADYDEAARLAAELQPMYPDNGRLALLAGQALLGQGRMRAATEAFARSVTIDPLEPEGHYHFGFAAVRIGDFERAEHAWEHYLRLTSGNDDEERGAVTRALDAVRSLSSILETGASATA